MIFASEKQHHAWWVFPTAIAFGVALATFMGAPMGRQVGKAFSVCEQQKSGSKKQ
ncbi:hypothetical protein P378_14030 [Desulforamulus profundi]|uniref:Uncharacterized protein n=1 Tax=Desulforamulus profundi TaxID=1383067 RepID=A0A2C6MEM6_9FIRM|nr:hypothetical protein [Desulforamulus profundi]PHJ37766.1 hypothetical protein P378_14030 [Desulforamulus profundi]